MNLSFAGCGFLGIYHVGVASCFKEYAPHIILNKIAGASVGSIAAAALLCDISLGQTTTDILSVAVKARSQVLGPFSPRFDLHRLVSDSLEKALPPDAHIRCSGRLFISVTKLPEMKNMLISDYSSREELKQALLCSCFIPGYSGLVAPTFRGQKCADGGLSDNLPVLDENTITVSPFAGEHDICPQDRSCNILQVNVVNTSIAISPENMYRFYRILFPPKPEILSKMCQQGFDDALKYLQRKNIIACTRCLGVQSSLQLAETSSESGSDRNSDIETNPKEHSSDNCMECKAKRQKAHSSDLPAAVVNAIEEVCEQFNRGIINWLLRFAPVKWLSYIGKPYIVPMAIPVDITLVIISKVYEKLPSFRNEIQSKLTAVINLTKQILSKFDRNRHLYSAKFSCQLAITEFDYTEENVVSSYAIPFESSQPHETCSIKTEEEKVPKRKLSFKVPESSILLHPASNEKQQRKSYAGFPSNYKNQNTERIRRKSLTEVSQPERVIRNMKFGFTVDLVPSVSAKDQKKNVVEALQSLGEEDNEINVIELANKALSLEREYIGQHQEELDENSDTLNKILSASQNEALMSYYYVDEDKSVKITELYNVTDADTSVVLTDEEREVNNELSWDKDWIHMSSSPSSHGPVSIADTLDDDEFITSDDDMDLRESNDTFCEDVSPPHMKDSYAKPPPRRKKSFIIVN